MIKLPSPVAHLIHNDPEQPPSLPHDKSYAFILAGNGLYKFAKTSHLEALIPVYERVIPGLPPLTPYAHIKSPHNHRLFLSEQLLHSVLTDARKAAQHGPVETMYHFLLFDDKVRILKPRQKANQTKVAYIGGEQANTILDLHSHHELDAYFSGIDTKDEQGFRFYATIGKIFSKPELALRIGIYGDHWRLPITELFRKAGPFKDSQRRKR